MVEVTRISNIQVTMVEKMDDKDAEAILKGKDDFNSSVAATMKKAFDADDVQPWKNSMMCHFTKVE